VKRSTEQLVLLAAYRIAPVRLKCSIVLASLDLAESYNRWHVMSHVGAMLSPTADTGLIDRLLIEINLLPEVAHQLRRMERRINWRRDGWHEKLGSHLTATESKL